MPYVGHAIFSLRPLPQQMQQQQVWHQGPPGVVWSRALKKTLSGFGLLLS
jgi:hypothetical protein